MCTSVGTISVLRGLVNCIANTRYSVSTGLSMPLGIDPKVDFAFKMVFGNPKHTNVTIHS